MEERIEGITTPQVLVEYNTLKNDNLGPFRYEIRTIYIDIIKYLLQSSK